MNHEAVLCVAARIREHPDKFIHFTSGEETVMPSLHDRNPLVPLSVAEWAVMLFGNGDVVEERRIRSSLAIRHKVNGPTRILAEVLNGYATELLRLDAVEDIVLHTGIWPTSWWNPDVPFDTDRYFDLEDIGVPIAVPTPDEAATALERMANHAADWKELP